MGRSRFFGAVAVTHPAARCLAASADLILYPMGGAFFMQKQRMSIDRTLYKTPFSKAYWAQAASEMDDLRMLLFAALMIALRVALKSVKIPIAPYLSINVAFFVNAYGAMVFGPVVAMWAAAISDTLGYILVPDGVYFFPFVFTEMAGSLIFALFLYRTEVTALRVTLSRFCVDFFVNVVLTTPIMHLYYRMILGKNYALFDAMRIVKNLFMFPIESALLTAFLCLVIPPTRRLGFVYSGTDKLTFSSKTVFMWFECLIVLGTAAFAAYLAMK